MRPDASEPSGELLTKARERFGHGRLYHDPEEPQLKRVERGKGQKRALSMKTIAHQRVTDVGEMHANLVSTPRAQRRFDPRMGACSLSHPNVGSRGEAVFRHGGAAFPLHVTEGRIDDKTVRVRNTVDERKVGLAPTFERLLAFRDQTSLSREEERAGGPAVELVHRPHTPTELRLKLKLHAVGILEITPRRSETGRLVHHKPAAFIVENLKGHVSTYPGSLKEARTSAGKCGGSPGAFGRARS